MRSQSQTSSELLCAEILAQAQREREEIIRRTQAQAESILDSATAEAARLNQEQLAKARSEASRRAELILATVPLEIQRLRCSHTEDVLESIYETARNRLLAGEGFNYRQALVVMAVEALRQMDGDNFAVKLSPSDYLRFGLGLAEEIGRHGECSGIDLNVAQDPSVKGGGLLVQDTQGHQVVDNRFLARLERFWPELRRQIAGQAGLISTEQSPKETHAC